MSVETNKPINSIFAVRPSRETWSGVAIISPVIGAISTYILRNDQGLNNLVAKFAKVNSLRATGLIFLASTLTTAPIMTALHHGHLVSKPMRPEPSLTSLRLSMETSALVTLIPKPIGVAVDVASGQKFKQAVLSSMKSSPRTFLIWTLMIELLNQTEARLNQFIEK